MRLRRRLAGQITPFAAGALLGFAVVPIHNAVDWSEYALAAALTLAVVATGLFAPWGRLPRVARLAPPLMFLLAVALLRESGGGNGSGVSTLALLPVFWLALHGTPRQLTVMVVAVWAFYLAPVLLIGGTHYPASGWRSSLVIAGVAAIIGFTTQRLVARERGHADDVQARERDLEKVSELSHSLFGSVDPRHDICAAICDLSGAFFASLMEPQPDGTLVTTAAAGFELPPMELAPGSPSWVMDAFVSRTAQFGDPRRLANTHADMHYAAGRPAAVLVEPVLRGDDATGVFVVGWGNLAPEPQRVTRLVRLLATEAAFVIERADLLERLTAVAATDALTGLPNRRSWDEHLAVAVASDDPFCVAMIDLDFFKAFNDDHGHQAGDDLLEAAAAAWRHELRPTDVLARYGGEEFVVLLQGCGVDAARPVIERLRGVTPSGQSCSAGIAARRPGEDGLALVGRADEALYAAKRAGRDQLLAA